MKKFGFTILFVFLFLFFVVAVVFLKQAEKPQYLNMSKEEVSAQAERLTTAHQEACQTAGGLWGTSINYRGCDRPYPPPDISWWREPANPAYNADTYTLYNLSFLMACIFGILSVGFIVNGLKRETHPAE